jgi:hypothetical protein
MSRIDDSLSMHWIGQFLGKLRSMIKYRLKIINQDQGRYCSLPCLLSSSLIINKTIKAGLIIVNTIPKEYYIIILLISMSGSSEILKE